MASTIDPATERDPTRPIPDSYWLVPGRLLAGAYPGSHSRADALDRLRRFVAADFSCFIDLTEPDELPPYEPLLPQQNAQGRRIEHFREPIRDHSVPTRRESMARVLELIDDGLKSGHNVYVHCRAGIGRSATVAACWLIQQGRSPEQALAELQTCWRQSSRSRDWLSIPETEEQLGFVRHWRSKRTASQRVPTPTVAAASVLDRVRGAFYGMAAGDAAGASAAVQRGGRVVRPSANPEAFNGEWSQPTAMTLCLADSLLETGNFDAHDQIARYLRWQREGRLSAAGRAIGLTPDIEKALARYQWRRLPMAGSHDPNDRTTASLPRTLAAVAFTPGRAANAVALAEDCSRTTHQAPVVLDACRYYAAMLYGALRGDPATAVLGASYLPEPALWTARPLKREVAAMAADPAAELPRGETREPDAILAVARARRCVARTGSLRDAVLAAIQEDAEPALAGALTGALAGALYGAAALPADWQARLAQREWLERFSARLAARAGSP